MFANGRQRVPFKGFATLFVVCWCWGAIGVFCYFVNMFVHWPPLNFVGMTGLLAIMFAMFVGVVAQLFVQLGPFGSTGKDETENNDQRGSSAR
jgi:hypothetical protein